MNALFACGLCALTGLGVQLWACLLQVSNLGMPVPSLDGALPGDLCTEAWAGQGEPHQQVLVLCRTQTCSVTSLQDQKLLTCSRKAKQMKVLCKLLWLCSFAMQTLVKMMTAWINNMLSALSAKTEHYKSIWEICACMFSLQPLKLLSRGSSDSIPSAPPSWSACSDIPHTLCFFFTVLP